MKKINTQDLAFTALFTALVFVATYIIKIPNPATGGYSHTGDCMIFLAVMILGKRNGSIAAAIGAALSDLLAGAAVWVLPTLIIKFIAAYIAGTIMEKSPASRKLQMTGAACGGIFQIIAYTLVKIVLMGTSPALLSIPHVTAQTLLGIVLFAVLARVLSRNGEMAVFMKRGENR